MITSVRCSVLVVLVVLSLACTGAGSGADTASTDGDVAAADAAAAAAAVVRYSLQQPLDFSINITTTGFVASNGRLDKVHTCEGFDESPFITWEGVPDSAASLALIMEDPDSDALGLVNDVIVHTLWTHWVVHSIPPDVSELAAGQAAGTTLASGGIQGTNDYQAVQYNGPCPMPYLRFPGLNMVTNKATKQPLVSEERPYLIRLYALDGEADIPPAADRDALLQAADGHILAAGEMVLPYKSRKSVPCRNPSVEACLDQFWIKPSPPAE